MYEVNGIHIHTFLPLSDLKCRASYVTKINTEFVFVVTVVEYMEYCVIASTIIHTSCYFKYNYTV